jgi:flagellin-like protein
MSAQTKKVERRQRFRRLRRGETRSRAVSPVVATLILILIAVAAAAALYLWLVAWQGGVTSGIGSPGAQYTLSIGGSTSAYPFDTYAVTQFEQNNTDVVISNNQGGTGAGMAAVCSGQLDIGMASAPQVDATLISNDACPQTVVQETVAYDGVDAIVPTANVHGLQSLSWDTLQSIYVASSTSQSALTSNVFAIGALHANGMTDPFQPAALTGFTWDEIPACAPAQAVCANGAADLATTTGTTVTPCTSPNANDICAATLTPCGFTVCAGGTGAGTAAGQFGATITTYARSEVSGTTQSFIARLMAVGATGTTPQGIGFTGCSGDNQFDGCGITIAHTGTGNPAVISDVAGSEDSIGYASDGLVQQTGSGVIPINFQGFGQSIVITLSPESNALKYIAAGIAAYNGGSWTATTVAYVGWRPFVAVETAPPTGETLRYLQFVMDPANNENFASEAAEISVYASGLAGVVPVTPIP